MTKEEKRKIDDYFEERAWLDSWDGAMSSLEWNARDAALNTYYNEVIKPLLKKED